MDISDRSNKLRKGSVSRKKPEKDAEALTKKEFFLIYSAYAAFANACKETMGKAKRRRALTRKAVVEEKHLNRAIIFAESWTERDKLYRRLAKQCYETSSYLKKTGALKESAKWMNLTLRFLRLSLDPKSKEEMDRVLNELVELKTAMKEHEGEQEEDLEESPGD
jgi:hypothetical protein